MTVPELTYYRTGGGAFFGIGAGVALFLRRYGGVSGWRRPGRSPWAGGGPWDGGQAMAVRRDPSTGLPGHGANHEWKEPFTFAGSRIPRRRGDPHFVQPMKIEKHRIVTDKLGYAKGQRPAVDCILCAVTRKDPRVDDLTVFQAEGFFITLNLFPYNPGHLMVVPEKHYEHLRELSNEETLRMHRLQVFSMEVLDQLYQPGGYNLGYNLGQASGASISHLHLQIVPAPHSHR